MSIEFFYFVKLFELLKIFFAYFNKQEVKEPDEVEFKDDIVLVAEDHCEHLICKKCGKEYNSSGLHDIGICKDCLKKENFIGGPLGT